MNRLIRRAILAWENWKSRKAIHRVLPAIRDLDRLEASYRAQHKRGSARIAKAKKNVLHASLRAYVEGQR